MNKHLFIRLWNLELDLKFMICISYTCKNISKNTHNLLLYLDPILQRTLKEVDSIGIYSKSAVPFTDLSIFYC
ncbi:hypothetical protein EUGRSUZ_H01163 [Eucalyptus grandis]|uniref:Uncharacterized protein n=2 Tax=Eucalyptus grandis TaxID=71139 RepID=A0ACC3JPA8_EUCGR|nr:hypothetical protein EUGRSUZ_H01163 [Eucalyptus grandis]